MDVATSFVPLLQVFAVEMTQPTFHNLVTLFTGWIFAPRRTVLGMIRSSGVDRHHAAFHRLLATARWSVDAVGLALFDRITSGVKIVFLSGDDTLLSRCGLKVFGTGMHRDPVLSSRSHTVTRWGHCWVVLCVVIESRWCPGRRFALPVLCRLYLDKASARKWNRAYRKKTDLMLDMLRLLAGHVSQSGKRLHFMGDSAYTAPAVLHQMPPEMAVTGRVVVNARLHEPAPPRREGKVGRPRKRGARLPTPREMLAQKGLPRRKLKLYDGPAYHVRIAEQTGCFYKAPQRQVRVVAVEHLRGGRGVEVFYTTEMRDETGLETKAETVLTWYSWRWPIEVTFHDAKQHLGVDEPQNRTLSAVRRTAPLGFLLYSLIVWWHETARSQPATPLRMWSKKHGASFADMLAALRAESLEKTAKTHFSTPDQPAGVRKTFDILTTLIKLAA
jgi:hypothetical protein